MAAIAVKQLLAGSAALLFLLTRRDLTGLTIKKQTLPCLGVGVTFDV